MLLPHIPIPDIVEVPFAVTTLSVPSLERERSMEEFEPFFYVDLAELERAGIV